MDTIQNKWPCSIFVYFYYWLKSVARLLQRRSKKMKLAAIYNLFDGEEILPYSLRNIRSQADKIIVVCQLVSNRGEKASPQLVTLLQSLQKEGLIDYLWCYTPNLNRQPTKNELAKRKLGRKLALALGCTHFIHMDTDEFFVEHELIKAKKHIAHTGIKSSAVSIIEYLKSPCYEILNGYTAAFNYGHHYMFYAPFITAIVPSIGKYFPTYVDPTRRANGNLRFWLFPKHEIALHHFSTLRKNLARKYNNSSLHSSEIGSLEANNKLGEISNWTFEQNKLSDDLARFNDLIIKKVPNLFNLPEEL